MNKLAIALLTVAIIIASVLAFIVIKKTIENNILAEDQREYDSAAYCYTPILSQTFDAYIKLYHEIPNKRCMCEGKYVSDDKRRTWINFKYELMEMKGGAGDVRCNGNITEVVYEYNDGRQHTFSTIDEFSSYCTRAENTTRCARMVASTIEAERITPK